MICTECGKYIEFFSAELEGLQDAVASQHDFKITHHTLRMWGICAECQPLASAAAAEGSGTRIGEATAEPRVRISSSGHVLK
jgi:Fur family ferric uptake transcriptional regulator